MKRPNLTQLAPRPALLPMSRPGRLVVSIAACLLTSACALPPVNSYDQLKREDDDATQAARTNLVEASRALAEGQAQLQRDLERIAPPTLSTVMPPLPDPLSEKQISLSMQNARIGQLLWILAKDYGLSLSIEPSVLEMPQTVNLYLQKVTARQALDHILRSFDVYGIVGLDNVLTVKMSEERLFNLETLASKSALDLTSGGDSLGGGKDGGTGMKNNLSIKSEVGEKTDPMDAVIKMVDAVLQGTDAQASAGAPTDGRERPRMSVNRASGTMFLRAKPSAIRSIEELIGRESRFRQQQIQIDAQILDVTLNDDSRFGIDWNLFGSKVAGRFGANPMSIEEAAGTTISSMLPSRAVTIPAQALGFTGATGGGLGFRGNTFSVALNALKSFGNVRVLSNPSVMVRNGMPAYLNVGNSIRYIQKITSNTNNTSGGATTTSVDVVTDAVFSGVVVGVSAVVKKGGLVEIFIQPSQTQVSETSLIPFDVGQGNKVSLPRVNMKSLATTLNVQSGDTVVIGGLIDRQDSGTTSGLPGLLEVPGLGKAFSTEVKQDTARELVVVLRARAL